MLLPGVGLLERGIAGVAADQKCLGLFLLDWVRLKLSPNCESASSDFNQTCLKLPVTLWETAQTSAHFRDVALVFETFSNVSNGSHSANCGCSK